MFFFLHFFMQLVSFVLFFSKAAFKVCSLTDMKEVYYFIFKQKVKYSLVLAFQMCSNSFFSLSYIVVK